jgi:hypothetical protein
VPVRDQSWKISVCALADRLESPYTGENIFGGKFCLCRPKKLFGTGELFVVAVKEIYFFATT